VDSKASRLGRIKWAQLVLELIVVVGGILIALGIDSWAAERQEAELEEAFLQQLHDDLGRAEVQLADQLASTEAAERFTLNLLEVARGERTPPNDTLAAWLIRAMWFSDPRPTVSTAQALAESENLYILRSPGLRTAVVTLIDRINQLESRLLPFEMRLVESQSILTRWVDPGARGLTLTLGMTGVEIDALRSGIEGPVEAELLPIVRRPEFLALFVDIFWNHETLRWNQLEMLDATTELREEVAKELM
jgi:hypothetical protein